MHPARRPRRRILLGAGCVAAAAATALATAGPPAAAGPGGGAGHEPKQPVATGRGGAVASVDLDASRAGISVLRRGGNAIDAAVATAATLGVTEPFVAGPGGGGFMVVYLAKQHRVITIDGRETCPAACTTDLFVENGKPLGFEEARHSGLAVGVPGMVDTWAQAAKRYGKRSFAQDLQPAIQRARRGFIVDDTFVQETKESLADLQAFTSSRRLFLKDGQPLPVGTRLRNPDLARTYRLLAQHGPRYLYDGPLATAIARTVQHPPVWKGTPLNVRPGIMTTKDLARYHAEEPAPTHVAYRGYDVYGMPPPSSGGSTTGEALNILSGYPMSSESRALALHHYLESLRYSFADRNRYVGDPDYVDVPLHGLLDPAFAATRRCLITDQAAASPVAPGDPHPPYTGCSSGGTAAPAPDHEQSTNNIVTADKWGNVVAYTNTIEHFAGTGMTVPGYGFLLNNEMTDFDFVPATPGTPDVNLPAGGKIPRSSMNPTVVLRDGKPAFAVGSPGGATIITTVLQILINRIDFGMSMEQAIAAPRVGNFNTPTSFAEQAFLDSPVAKQLEDEHGQKFSLVTGPLQLDKEIGAATAVELLSGNRFRADAEPVRRGGGSALVVRPN
ncbi:MAG TPA: gamma-glutamyltransferase [Segeticoccus sp.]|uniref:gamma-glutamyltransferase n=1 Tax=Segeticoccus sp. TaxID=2706531 RepID=UPI002D7F9408|nr:gamma-glutamyltransferase [Segeticoccus sp.]HET8600362.1 gamma-glutamyltransferase [Segeticoccus sp.]